MPNLYTTLHEYSSHKKIGGGSQATPVATLRAHERTILLQDLQAASQRIDTWCGRHFYPLLAENFYDHGGGKMLELGDHDLVEISAVWTANRTVELTLADIYAYTGNNHNYAVKDNLRIKRESGEVFYVGTGVQKASSVVGIWTYHEHWANAWLSSLDTVQTTQAVGSTILTVKKVDGVNGLGAAPRFQVGQLLQIGDEWQYVADTDSVARELTVARAQNGTTAVEHAAETAIYIYQPMSDISKACRVLTDYFRRLPAHPEGKMQTLSGAQISEMSMPVAVQQILEPYRRVLFGAYEDDGAYFDGVRQPPIGSKYP